MRDLQGLVEEAARVGEFCGVVRVDAGGDVVLERVFGFADRAHGIAMTADTRLGIASGSKAFTALAVLSLVEDGVLGLDATARSLLGNDLPLIADDVTVGHLLAHRSGIGDYLDEEDEDGDPGDYVLARPVHELDSTEAFLPLLDGFPTKFPAGDRFSYCNAGFVVLALLAERASGVGYHDLVRQKVIAPAGLGRTEFLRSDNLPGDAAVGYVQVGGEWRTNVFHLPVLASGDGGLHTTAADVRTLWEALFADRIISTATREAMLRPRSDVPEEKMRYGLGVWLHESRDVAILVGSDPGVSFRSVHDPAAGLTHTTIGNTSSGAWRVTFALDEALGLGASARS
jgi:CubicO group peptidase (beta-lactamase class C family)